LVAFLRRAGRNAVIADPQAIEEKAFDRQSTPQRFDVELAAEAAHGHLERLWAPRCVEGNGLAVEYQRVL
jgi:hypothetical protein